MSKIEFLEQLERLLMDIPIEERKEAIRYYQDYFDDAVDLDETQVIEKIGSPEKIARQIKGNLYNKDSNEAGVYTESGYSNAFFEDEKDEIDLVGTNNYSNYNESTKQNQSYQNNNASYNTGDYNKKPSQNNTIWWVIILAVTFPIWGTVVFSVTVGLGTGLFGLVVGFGAAFIGLFISGIYCIGVGISQLFINPLIGMLLIGTGFILFALALCFFSLTLLIVGKLIPLMIKGIRYVIDKVFNRGERR